MQKLQSFSKKNQEAVIAGQVFHKVFNKWLGMSVFNF